MIDKCSYTFRELTDHVLPERMRELHAAIRTPYPMADFNQHGVGVKTLLKRYEYTSDIHGCYVIIDGVPNYVGISKKIVARLRGHVRGTNHYAATLAYTMASKATPHAFTRNDAMKDPGFMQSFEEAKAKICDMYVAWIEIKNPLVLYLFEAYAAMELNTKEWNTFETH